MLKINKKRIIKLSLSAIALVLVIAMFLALSQCSTEMKQLPMFKQLSSYPELEDETVAENDDLAILWDDNDKVVYLLDKKTGTKWGPRSIESDAGNGVTVSKKIPKIFSSIYISYYDKDSCTVINDVLAQSASVEMETVAAKTVKNGVLVRYDFPEEKISVTVSYTLKKNSMVVTVDKSKITEGSRKLVTSVSVAPFMCSVFKDDKDAYLFVPSGSGALIYPETVVDKTISTEEKVFGDDAAINKDFEFFTGEAVRLPVYGTKVGNSGLCAIITSDEEKSEIDTVSQDKNTGMSAVYAKTYIRGYDIIDMPEGFGSGGTTKLVSDPIADSVFAIEFYPFGGENCSYVDMAEIYRNYLYSANKKETEKTDAETAYEIEFDYKITELDAAQSVNAFDIGICLVGPNTVEPDDKTWGNNRVNSNQQLFITKETVKATEGWEKYKQVYIVPSDADLSQTNKLAILCKVSTKRYAIYFDNVKVRKINFTYTLKFDTAGGEEIEPLAGAKGEEYTLPQTAVKEGCIFLGWYEDKDFKTPASDGVFEEEVKTIYAKFKKLQYIQGFEEEWVKFPVVRSDWFEYAFWYNTTADPGSRKSWAQWTAPGLAYEYNSDGVRSGQGSVYTPGLDAYTRLFTLFLKDPLVVGEKYTLSFWVKLVDYTLPGNFELWFNNGDWNSGKLRTPVDWGSGARSAIVINTSTMRENKEEWIEVKFEFTALGKFMGIGVPGLTECYIDDARITDESADKSYIRTTEGKGKKFEDWYSQSGADDDKYVPIEEKDDPIIIRYVALEGIDADFNTGTNDNYSNNDDNTNYQDNDNTNGNNDSKQSGGKKTVRVKMKKKKTQTDTENSSTFPVWLIVIAGVSVLAMAAGAVSAVVITKKRKSSSK